VSEVFADTSGWATFLIRTEPHFAQANALMRNWRATGVKVITTNYVLLELVALFTSPLRIARPRQIEMIDMIRNALWVETVHIEGVK
jgi:predicted nucleic acid-binding protein